MAKTPTVDDGVVVSTDKPTRNKGLWVKQNREWARQQWDTYGFDYDGTTGEKELFVWPLPDVTMAELEDALREDGIEFYRGTKLI